MTSHRPSRDSENGKNVFSQLSSPGPSDLRRDCVSASDERLSSGNAVGVEQDLVDVRALLQGVVRQAFPWAEVKGLHLMSRIDKSLPRYLVLRDKALDQLLLDTLQAAIEMSDWGTICVNAEHAGWTDQDGMVVRFQILLDEQGQWSAEMRSLLDAIAKRAACAGCPFGMADNLSGERRFWVEARAYLYDGADDIARHGAERDGESETSFPNENVETLLLGQNLFDQSIALQLWKALGEETFIEVLEEYRVQASSLLAIMQQETLLPEIRRAAHDVRSTAMSFGLHAAATRAAHIERMCLGGHRPAAELLVQLEQALSGGIDQLLTYFANEKLTL